MMKCVRETDDLWHNSSITWRGCKSCHMREGLRSRDKLKACNCTYETPSSEIAFSFSTHI